VGTHDLPTVAGIWNLTEPDHRLHRLRQRLLDVVRAREGASTMDAAFATYRVLSRARSRIVLAQLEDALGVEERPNVPGTIDEFPNWRLALPSTLEEITRAKGPRRIGSVMKRARRSR
jgi:4-alpha-glucanotransferase